MRDHTRRQAFEFNHARRGRLRTIFRRQPLLDPHIGSKWIHFSPSFLISKHSRRAFLLGFRNRFNGQEKYATIQHAEIDVGFILHP